MKHIVPYLTLMRPPNLVTAAADILLGYAAVGAVVSGPEIGMFSATNLSSLFYLIFASMGLYGGGVVLNDYFDADLDAKERPERPIPSGRVPKKHALALGLGLYGIAFVFSACVSLTSLSLAVIVALLATAYDARMKHSTLLGPLFMGLCRSGNLLLGMSIIPENMMASGYIIGFPLCYIMAITSISQGEVHGGRRSNLVAGGILYLLVTGGILLVAYIQNKLSYLLLPFVLLFALRVFPPLAKALKTPSGSHIGKAVKAGVLSMTILDATLATGFAGWQYGLIVLLLWPLSMLVAKAFAVT